ncbi:ATP-binding domain-containing protein [Halorhodospira halophila]|uniref:Uncharacterized protein n=1 Tax=Halorhodospira halophila (strain DSM 244 / SL1) TaxID=349124 RepID=A1WU49_HALHL|nr:ATP-binding domain-containing protein [Halorhodospira halophila]ABM61211.1 conserved hypothetical protein [Halorhodospira halophila SL1]MBK1730156.1 hypothetical protein [Halorhodospira halophila]
MAHVHPSNIDTLRLAGAPERELRTLEWLGDSLPQSYTVYHGVHWSAGSGRGAVFGEVDFVVVNAAGEVLLIEQKNGALAESDGLLGKDYGHERGPKDVVRQLHRSREGLLGALERGLGGRKPPGMSLLLYCPAHRLQGDAPAGLSREQIVDASRVQELPASVEAQLGPGQDAPDTARTVRRVLAQELDLAPDLGDEVTLQEQTFQRLAGGITELVQGLEMSPWRLRVIGAAGSGKTIAAIEFFEAAQARGERPALVCFNRVLGDRLRARLEGNADVGNFHRLCHAWLEAVGESFDAQRARREPQEYWSEVADRLIEHSERLPCFDRLIVDEGQDFSEEWWELLRICLVDDDAPVLWLEDPQQDLYGRNDQQQSAFVTYRTGKAFRTPRRIAQFVRRLLEVDIDWRNPLDGHKPRVTRYATADEQREALLQAVEHLESEGFRKDQMVLLSLHGHGRDPLAETARLGRYRLKRFTGDFTEDGQPVYSKGDLRVETVYRFKGEQRPAVILMDVDFDGSRPEREQRLLYCALTRASVACEVLVAEGSAWRKRLENAAS